MGFGDDILVVKRNVLLSNNDFQGFKDFNEIDFTSVIKNNIEYKERCDELENDASYLQIIPYVWLVNPSTKKVFLYKREPSKSEYKEVRHMNKYSGGVGGHIDKSTEEGSEDPITDAMMRELKEELVMNNYPTPKYIGYINDDSDKFNEVHFGIVALAETNEEEIGSADGVAHGSFYSSDEVEKLFSNPENEVETWTQTSWPVIKDYLDKLE